MRCMAEIIAESGGVGLEYIKSSRSSGI